MIYGDRLLAYPHTSKGNLYVVGILKLRTQNALQKEHERIEREEIVFSFSFRIRHVSTCRDNLEDHFQFGVLLEFKVVLPWLHFRFFFQANITSVAILRYNCLNCLVNFHDFSIAYVIMDA